MRLVFTLRWLVSRKSWPRSGMSPEDRNLADRLDGPLLHDASDHHRLLILATTVVLAVRLLVVGPSTGSVEAISSVLSLITIRM